MRPASRLLLASFGAALLVSESAAQNTLHYWSFSTSNDSVGGVSASAVGTPDLSLNASYGEAYSGSGPSLNTVLGGIASGGGFLLADVYDELSGTATSLDFGSGSFAISYWSFDENDGDARGPRVFDCLDTTTTGFQQGTNISPPNHNFRIDDDAGNVVLGETAGVAQAMGQWVHVVINVNRTQDQIDLYFDGANVGTIDISTITGSVFATQDMEIGVLNGGNGVGPAQACGLDDLAFYDDLLSPGNITDLANATITPLDLVGGLGTPFCNPAVSNSTGVGGVLTVSGSATASNNDLTLTVVALPANQFGYFLTSPTQGFLAMPAGSQGNLCLALPIGRYNANIFNSGPGGSGSLVLDLTNTPSPTTPVSVMAGETRNWQCWYRDVNPTATSNFTSAVAVTFN